MVPAFLQKMVCIHEFDVNTHVGGAEWGLLLEIGAWEGATAAGYKNLSG
jgi:hypothetical protein